MGKRRAYLEELAGAAVIIRVDRSSLSRVDLEGYLVEVSEELAVLQLLDDHTMTLNGYAAIRRRDIRRWRIDDGFRPRSLALRGEAPGAPDLPPDLDWRSLLCWASHRYPLVGVEMEEKAPGCIWVGAVARTGRRRVSLDTVDADGTPGAGARLAYAEITQVTFGDGYTTALAELLAHEAHEADVATEIEGGGLDV